MKSRISIKTRLLALALTVLMTVGVLPFSVFAVGNDKTDNTIKTDNTLFRAPTGEEIEKALGDDGKLLYYNDYNSITDASSNVSQTTLTNGAYKNAGFGNEVNSGIIKMVDDGNGGKALLRVNKDGNINHSLYVIGNGTYSTHRRPAPENQGMNFVFSSDYRLDGAVTAGQFLVFSSWAGAYQSTTQSTWTAIPLWITAEGKVYAASDSWTTSRGGVTCGVTAPQNAMQYADAMSEGCEYICTLSTTEFVNIAVQVKDNHFKVYLNGEAKTDWKLLMSDSAKALYKEAGDKLYTTGEFALCAIAHHYRNKTADGTDHFVHDNTTVYASDEYVTIFGKSYDSNLTAEDFMANPAEVYNSSASYWKSATINGMTIEKDVVYDNGQFWRKSTLDGGAAGQDAGGDYKALSWAKGYAGVDVALTFELQAQSDATDCTFQMRTYAGGEDMVWGRNFLKVKKTDGGYELWISSDVNDTGYKIADVPTVADGRYIKIQALFDLGGVSGSTFEASTLYIYVDGKLVGSCAWGTTLHSNVYAKQSEWVAEAGENAMPMGIMIGGITLQEGGNNKYNIKNLGMYYYDDDADGDVSDTVRKVNVTAPTLLHYNNFDSLTSIPDGGKFTSSLVLGNNLGGFLTTGSGEALVDDGKGGKALTYKQADSYPSGFQGYYQISGIAGNGVATANSGKSFVISADYKLTSTHTDIDILGACAWSANTTKYGRDLNVTFVYAKADGGIYVSRKSDDTSKGVFVNDYVQGWQNGELIKIGSLSSSRFTNVAVAVNVAANTFKVYINGVDATGDLQFLTDSDKAQLDASETYPNGFGYSYTRINFSNAKSSTSDSGMILDNVAAYLYGDIVKKNNNPLNGYIKDGDSYYYYNNGNIATNFTSADGLMSAGLDGVVKHGVEKLANINSIYKYVGTDVIPVDGVFSGVYSYTKSGTTYCFDTSKSLIRNVAVYDAVTAGTETDTKKAVGFSINENGVAAPLNGYYEVADGESYYYVNGVRTKGMVEINGDIFYIADDYTMFAGYKTVNGKTYFFDATANNTGSLVNGVHTVDGTAKFYEDGVYKTGLITTDTTKYFADSDGKLLTGIQLDPVSGKQYFFFESGEDMYKSAVGASVLWNGTIITIGDDGIIDTINGKVYGEWKYIDGTWYYSDVSGNVTKGFAYIDKSPEGQDGGYYYFDENGKFVKETFAMVYGTLMYFHTDGKAPTGVVFVSYNAENFPATAAACSVDGEMGVDGEYMNFVNGVLPSGVTEVISDGYLYKFSDGRYVSRKALNPDNPEILVHINKDGREDTLTFNSNDDGTFDILLAQYPCYKITVYDVTTGEKVEITANAVIDGEASGRYTLVGTHTYEVYYKGIDHELDETPVRVVDATCASDGYREYKCKYCNYTEKEMITEHPDHVFNENDVIVIIAPECNKKGVGVIYCANGCGCNTTVDVAATGEHNWVLVEDECVASTCTTAGYNVWKCSYECCHEYKHEALPLADHEYGAWTETVAADCVNGGVETRTCIHDGCTAKQERATAKNYDNHVHGSISRYDDENIGYYEYIKTDIYSTCLVNGKATYRCKDCGGFIYDVIIALDPDNHHYVDDEEYLAVINQFDNNKVIETVKIIGNSVYRNGDFVGTYTGDNTKREVMLSFSNMICGYDAEWRIDCKKGCENPSPTGTLDMVVYKVVGEVEGTFRHSFDLTHLYTTNNQNDQLYGQHYYKCTKCGKPAGAVAHNMIYTDNEDGTHSYHCEDGCIVEGTSDEFGTFNVAHTYEEKYNETHHWTECVCGATTTEAEHTLENGYDATHHWTKCEECEYISKTEHEWTDVAAKAPTCTEKGYTAHQKCDCGAKNGYEELGFAPHNYTGEYSCNADGHWYECTECHEKYSPEAHNYITIPALGATCVNNGYNEHQKCSACGYLNGYEEVPALGHNVEGQPYNYDDVEHWQICTRCSTKVSANHTLGELISDEEGTMQCIHCEHIVTDITLTWWYQLGLSRTTVEVDGVDYYRYTYSDTKNALVYLGTDATAGWYYFDSNGYLVLIGDTGVNNANGKADNGTFDTISAMGNTRGIITNAVITTANGIFYIKDGAMQYGWQDIDGKYYFFNTTLSDVKVNDGFEMGALVKPADGAYTITALNYTNDAVILVNVDENGARRLGVVDNGDGSASYYLDGTAGKLTGRIEDNYYNVGKLYFADADGKLYSGEWTSVNGIYYSFADVTTGEYPYSMVTWHMNDKYESVDGTTIIYTDGEGRKIITGWYLNHGVGGRYIVDGVMQTEADITNYMVIDDTYYALDAEGIASYYTGWNNEGTLYVSSGIIVKNRFERIGANEYYFDCDGQIVKAASGEMVKVFIGSWVYSIDDTGAAVQYVVGGENLATWVYFIKDGKVDTTEKGYYTSTGLITSQAYVIDTFTYIFDANGRLVTSKDNYECNGVVYVIDAEGKATVKDDEGEDAE